MGKRRDSSFYRLKIVAFNVEGSSIFKKKFIGLWLLSIITVVTLNIGPQVLPSKYFELPTFISFFERHYLSLKQKLLLQFNLAPSRPASEIEILRFKVSTRSKLWVDQGLKDSVAAALANHRGPIYSNIEPESLYRDSTLRKVFDLPNYIRDFRIQDGAESDSDAQEFLSNEISRQTDALPARFLKVRPADSTYFNQEFSFGSSNFAADLRSHFIYEYPLSIAGASRQLPTMLTNFLKRSGICSQVAFEKKGSLICEPSMMQIPDPMPLVFYAWSSPIAYRAEDIKNKDSILVVEIYDGEGLNSTLHKANVSWAEIFATALSNVIRGEFLLEPLWLPWMEVILMLALCAFMLLASTRLRLKSLIPLSMLGFGLYLLADFIATAFFRLNTQSVPEMMSLAVVSLVALSLRAVRESEDRSKLERALSGYLSPDRLQNVLSGRESLRLEGRRAELCTFILDIVGFSKISDKLSPEESFLLMRDFFSKIDPVIFDHHGFIDKKMGDGLIAVFGDDISRNEKTEVFTRHAVAAGLEIQIILKSDSVLKNQMLTTRIGINSGPVIIGNSGSERHFNYTVIGECVNFTQRLEAACPPGSVLVSEKVFDLCESDFEFRQKKISIKGDDRVFTAYEVLGIRGTVK